MCSSDLNNKKQHEKLEKLFYFEVFHKIIVSAHQRLQPLYDCLLTIIVNISPYLKSLSMVASNKLLHLIEVRNFELIRRKIFKVKFRIV